MKKLLLGLAICLIADGGAVCAEEAADTFDVFARAPAQADIVTERRANGTYVTRIPFAAVRSEWGDIRLLGASAEAAVSINLAPQANILSSRLVMRHVNGLSQSSLKPQLRMALNSHFLAQLPGVTETGAAINEVPIRTDFLQSGYNTLTLDAVQRYTLECQDPLAANYGPTLMRSVPILKSPMSGPGFPCPLRTWMPSSRRGSEVWNCLGLSPLMRYRQTR